MILVMEPIGVRHQEGSGTTYFRAYQQKRI